MKRNGFDKLNHQVTLLRKSAVQSRKDASNIVFALARGRAWKSVRSLDGALELDKPYVIRRVFKAPDEPKKTEEPVAALWTKSGWSAFSGTLNSTTRGDASIEVWS